MQNNVFLYNEGEDIFTMEELFSTVHQAIWEEIKTPRNINVHRRMLQREHLNILTIFVLKTTNNPPKDAIMLARYDLIILQSEINKALETQDLDIYTQAHLLECQSIIKSTLEAVYVR